MCIIWKLLLPLLLLTAVMPNSVVEGLRNYSSQLTDAVTSLNRVLNYMLVPQSVIGDMIFGVVLARGQLAVLKRHLLQSKDNRTQSEDLLTISLLESKCEEIYKNYMPIRAKGGTEEYEIIMSNIVQEDKWEVDNPLTLGKLRSSAKENLIRGGPFRKRKELTRREILYLLSNGQPNERQSDYCLGLLVSPRLCGTSVTCLNMVESKDEEVNGYPLTHRLLYLQVARQLGCVNQDEFSDVETLIRNFCSDILLQLYRIIELGVPVGFWDLFLEMVSLCGIEGFAEFLNPLYVDWILPLQAPVGCFADEPNESMGGPAKGKVRNQNIQPRPQNGHLPQASSTRQITTQLHMILPRKTNIYATYSGCKHPSGSPGLGDLYRFPPLDGTAR